MPPVASYQIAPIEAMTTDLLQGDGDYDLLDLAVSAEHDVRAKELQENLYAALDSLTWHLGIVKGIVNPEVGARYMAQGFVIGNLVADKALKFGLDEDEQSNKRWRVPPSNYFRDVQPEAVALFRSGNPDELDSLISAIEQNTVGPTSVLRQQLEYELRLERASEPLSAVRILGALTSYSLLAHERLRYREEWTAKKKSTKKAAAKAKKIAQIEAEILAMPVLPQLETGQSVELTPYVEESMSPVEKPLASRPKRFIRFNKRMLELIPMTIRRGIETYQAEREYWPEPKAKSGQTQRP